MGDGRISLKNLRNSLFNDNLPLMSLILAGSILLDSTFNKRKKRKILIMPDYGTSKIYVQYQYIDLNLFLHKPATMQHPYLVGA